MTRAVVFDLFHTLANPEDYRPADFDRIENASAAVGLDPALVTRHWLDNLHHVATSTLQPVELLRQLCEAQGISPESDALEAADHAIGRYQDDALLGPIPGTVETIQRLRTAGWLIGVLSNAHVRDIEAWPHSPLAPLVDVAHFSCFQGVAKPDAAAYSGVLDELGVAAEAATFVGDGGSNELAGAREAGFGSVILLTGPALGSGFRTPADIASLATDADATISEIGELPELTERLATRRR